jgi:hypothetical protein
LLQLIDRIFGEAGIRAADANLFALEALLDALHQRFAQVAMDIGMRLDQLRAQRDEMDLHQCIGSVA